MQMLTFSVLLYISSISATQLAVFKAAQSSSNTAMSNHADDDDDVENYKVIFRLNPLKSNQACIGVFFGEYRWILDLSDYEIILKLYRFIKTIPERTAIAIHSNCDISEHHEDGSEVIDNLLQLLRSYIAIGEPRWPKPYLASSTIEEFFARSSAIFIIEYSTQDVYLEPTESTETLDLLQSIVKLEAELILVKQHLIHQRPDEACTSVLYNLGPLAHNIRTLCLLYLYALHDECKNVCTYNTFSSSNALNLQAQFMTKLKLEPDLTREFEHHQTIHGNFNFEM